MTDGLDLKSLGDMAKVLETTEFLEGTSVVQRRTLRKFADELAEAIESACGACSPPTVVAFLSGAVCEATVAAGANPVAELVSRALSGGKTQQPQASPALVLACAYLARDLLVGERVE